MPQLALQALETPKGPPGSQPIMSSMLQSFRTAASLLMTRKGNPLKLQRVALSRPVSCMMSTASTPSMADPSKLKLQSVTVSSLGASARAGYGDGIL